MSEEPSTTKSSLSESPKVRPSSPLEPHYHHKLLDTHKESPLELLSESVESAMELEPLD